MSASAKPRDQFTILLKCGCGQTGTAVWEENSTVTPAGPETYLVSLTDGFYERIRKSDRRSIELVCQNCGTVMPD